MKNSIISATALLLSSICFSQNTQDVIDAVYFVNAKKNGKLIVDDTCHLVISNNKSVFAGVKKLKYQTAFIQKLSETTTLRASDFADYRKYFPLKIIKDYSKNTYDIIEDIGDQWIGYSSRDSLNKGDWQLLPDTLTVNNIFCNKAIRKDENGNTIEAWYAKGIPIQEGPLLTYGLPGLILKVTTSHGITATIVGIDYASKQKIEIPDYSLTSKEKIAEIKKQYNEAFRNGQTGIKVDMKKTDE